MRKATRSMESRGQSTQIRRMHLLGQVPVRWTIVITETKLKNALHS